MSKAEKHSPKKSSWKSEQGKEPWKEIDNPENDGNEETIKTEKENIENDMSTEIKSPTRISRKLEKEELANLNNRFACYIHKVRYLENENIRLRKEVESFDETNVREMTNVKSVYENELREIRKLVDEISKQKAELEIDSQRLFDENTYLKEDLQLKTDQCYSLQANLKASEMSINELSPKCDQLKLDRDRMIELINSQKSENNKLKVQIDEIRRSLEEEMLTRVEKENLLQTLYEELKFKEQVFEKEIIEKRTIKEKELTEINGSLNEKYNQKLLYDLQSIRQKYGIDLERNREEIEKLYEEKFRSLESQLARNQSSSAMAINEMKVAQLKLEEMNNKLIVAEKEKADSQQCIRSLEKQLENTKSTYLEEIKKHEEEINKLRLQMENQLKEYQELMDIKVALDLEISAYRKLLEGEEERLNIPLPSNFSFSSPRISQKRRKRECSEKDKIILDNFLTFSSSKCDIILDACIYGKCIKLTNKGNKNFPLLGCQLARRSQNASVIYVFEHKSFSLFESGDTVTIWSFNSRGSNDPPKSIKMKQNWPVSSETTTVLHNNRGVQILKIKQSVSNEYLEKKSEEVDGSPYSEEKCAIM